MTQRIFVSIASYRDPECQHTVRDLYMKAAHPERISVGICWQRDVEEDRDCFQLAPPLNARVRAIFYAVEESRGGCWARAEALSLLKEEDYVLQIDAHMRFAHGWDDLLLSALARCDNPKGVLSTLPPNYEPPDALQDCSNGIPLAHADILGGPHELQPLHIKGHWRPLVQTEGRPVPGAFIVGNFLFAPAEAIRRIPFDPHIYFRGQELVYSARLWTHGWDIYQPDRIILYHYFGSAVRAKKGTSYKDITDQALTARARVRHLLGVEKTTDAEALREIGKYGMGHARSLANYWRYSGIDLRTGTIEEKALHARWTPLPAPVPAETAFGFAQAQASIQPVWKSAVIMEAD